MSTMVTAVLPTMSIRAANRLNDNRSHVHAPSVASEATITPSNYRHHIQSGPGGGKQGSSKDGHSTIAGWVGMATGCGALFALAVFLPLPARFQNSGTSPELAIKYSYYVVASFAILISVLCFFGLRGLFDGQGQKTHSIDIRQTPNKDHLLRVKFAVKSYSGSLYRALTVGFVRKEIFVGYIGGFVARASSVAISLFIPLLVNAAFLSSGLCEGSPENGDPAGLPDLKRRCPRAYVLAAALTGVSQFVALVSAPLFGFWSSRVENKMVPLMFSAISAIVGYPLFALRFSPDDNDKASRAISFVAVCLIGIGQIGAIVCSLATLSSGIAKDSSAAEHSEAATRAHEQVEADDQVPLLAPTSNDNQNSGLADLKGSVAGIYSFYGGAGILILTKAGGALFDSTTTAAPFYMMASFNAVMLLSLIVLGFQP